MNITWLRAQLSGGRPVGYFTSVAEELNSGLQRTNPASGRMESLNPGPPDYKTNTALNHSAMLPPKGIPIVNTVIDLTLQQVT